MVAGRKITIIRSHPGYAEAMQSLGETVSGLSHQNETGGIIAT
jgi:hypothetical protein